MMPLGPPEKFYNAILKAFDKAIESARKEDSAQLRPAL